jgi:hypothetical protein
VSLEGDVAQALRALVVPPRVDAGTAAWFEAAWAEADAAERRGPFLSAFVAAGRRLGRRPVEPDAGERERLRTAGVEPFPLGLGVDECGRGALLLKGTAPLGADARRDLVADLYHRGEVRERQALLRVLAYLPEPAAFLEVAAEACRSSVQSVFEAVACENPYPAAHFAEPGFNQMVLKAVFTGAALSRVHGLARRANADLARMAEDYAAERRAAGRPVPEDLDRIRLAAARSA